VLGVAGAEGAEMVVVVVYAGEEGGVLGAGEGGAEAEECEQ
jgi:hypothetical protein